jgi:hypothetical protein
MSPVGTITLIPPFGQFAPGGSGTTMIPPFGGGFGGFGYTTGGGFGPP